VSEVVVVSAVVVDEVVEEVIGLKIAASILSMVSPPKEMSDNK